MPTKAKPHPGQNHGRRNGRHAAEPTKGEYRVVDRTDLRELGGRTHVELQAMTIAALFGRAIVERWVPAAGWVEVSRVD